MSVNHQITASVVFDRFRRSWIEDCLQKEIDPITVLEESMRNGIILAELAGWFTNGVVHRIFRASGRATFVS